MIGVWSSIAIPSYQTKGSVRKGGKRIEGGFGLFVVYPLLSESFPKGHMQARYVSWLF